MIAQLTQLKMIKKWFFCLRLSLLYKSSDNRCNFKQNCILFDTTGHDFSVGVGLNIGRLKNCEQDQLPILKINYEYG